MSVEAAPDSELRDLVAQALESNGLLSKLRAELRASVFLTLEENGKFKNKKFMNDKLRNFANTFQGCLVLSLVRDFLDFFGLEFTLSVLEPETGLGKDYQFENRDKIISTLNLDKSNDESKPLLSQVLELLTDSSESKQGAFKDNNVSAAQTKNGIGEKLRDAGSCNGTENDELTAERLSNQAHLRNGDIADLNDFNHIKSNDNKIFSKPRSMSEFSSVSANHHTTDQLPLPPLDSSSQNLISQNMKSLTISIDNNFQDKHIEDLLETNDSLKPDSLLSRDKNNENYLHSLHSHTFSGSEIEEEISSGDQFNDSLSLGDEEILEDGICGSKKGDIVFSKN